MSVIKMSVNVLKTLLMVNVYVRDNARLRGGNRPSLRVGRFAPPRRPLIPDNGHLEGHYPAYTTVTYQR